jgi:hypothetical protein
MIMFQPFQPFVAKAMQLSWSLVRSSASTCTCKIGSLSPVQVHQKAAQMGVARGHEGARAGAEAGAPDADRRPSEESERSPGS